jgi:hypothetical protein
MHVVLSAVDSQAHATVSEAVRVRTEVCGLVIVRNDSDLNAAAMGIHDGYGEAIIGDRENADIQ